MTFREFLRRLEQQCACTVVLQDPGGIPDILGGGVSGTLYYIERNEGPQAGRAFIEVHQLDTIAIPAYVRSICRDLGLDPAQLQGAHH